MNTTQELEATKQEMPEETERTRDCRCFVPRADIYEIEDQIVIVANVPGATEDRVEITIEKNVLTINAYVDPVDMSGYSLLHAEYEVGDYQRSFKLSDEIDSEKIEATIKDGVLRLYLPKSTAARTRKIEVKAA